MNIGWPQIIWLVVAGIDIGIHCARDNQPRKGKYDGVLTIITVMSNAALLYWGGFFSE